MRPLSDSIHWTPQTGSAVLVELPVGTRILPPPAEAARIQALFSPALEMRPDGIVVVGPVSLVSAGYLAERDAAELELHRRIESKQ